MNRIFHASAFALLVLGFALTNAAGAAAPPPAPAAVPVPQDTEAEVLWQLHCAPCHGPDGSGTGRARAHLNPPPRDLTLGVFLRRTTAPGALPTDEDITRVLRVGVPGTAMPGFNGLLTQDQLLTLVAYVKTLAPRFAQEAPPPSLALPPAPLSGQGAIDNGRATYEALDCADCHGADGRLRLAVTDAQGLTVLSTDLTAPWTFKNGSEAQDLFLTLTQGVDDDRMPSYAAQLDEGKRWELVFYLKTLARVPVWVQTDPERVRAVPTGGIADPLQRGEYLVRALGCGRCHTSAGGDGTYDAARALSGGARIDVWPFGTFYASNLTPDSATGLGGRSADDIVVAITQGRGAPFGLRRLNPWAMPWPSYAALTNDDAQAIAQYLQNLEPVYNAVPGPASLGFLTTFSGKFEMVLAGTPPRVEIHPGNFGNPVPGGAPLATPSLWQTLAPVLALVAVLLAGLVFYLTLQIVPRIPGMAPGRAHRSAAQNAATWVFPLSVLLCTWLYLTPLYASLPIPWGAEQLATLPPAVNINGDGKIALAERGRYIATIAGCASCHGLSAQRLFAAPPVPLTGGAQFRRDLFGTVYSANLTPDGTGLAGWNENDLLRAIRTGRSRSARALHWQAMPWDVYSNLTDEDARALVFYLQNLAPQPNALPAIVPPAAGDPPSTQITLADTGP